jgi:hypothetical protein
MTMIAKIAIALVIIIMIGVYFATCAFLGWLRDAVDAEQKILEREANQ